MRGEGVNERRLGERASVECGCDECGDLQDGAIKFLLLFC